MDLRFLQSTRFWKLVIIGFLEALVAVGVVTGEGGEAILRIVELILGGSVIIRTIDRSAEKIASVTVVHADAVTAERTTE
jgi:hypothetical protein